MGFRFEYRPGTIRYGAGCVADLGEELAGVGADRALVVCGRTVGSTPAVIDPVRDGLGDRLAGVFAETTPEKRIATAWRAAERLRETGADALVGLGGGSSLDVAKVASVLAAADRPRERVLSGFVRTGSVPVPDGELPPVAAVPTTLAGADLTGVAGITASPETVAEFSADGNASAAGDEEPEGDGNAAGDPAPDRGGSGGVHGGVGDPRIMPAALHYDPDLFRTTPDAVLLASAMNGFDKAIETPYARTATPVTDATAARALDLLSRGLPALGRGSRDEETMHDAVVGTVLAQYGASRPDGLTLSLIHAFGHALSRPYDLQQGAAHAVVAPHALRYLFERVDGRRRLLAAGLGVDADGDDEAVAGGVVGAVERIRDALGLPARLRDVDGPDREEFPAVAAAVLEDGFLGNAPPGLDPTREGIEAVLHEAW